MGPLLAGCVLGSHKLSDGDFYVDCGYALLALTGGPSLTRGNDLSRG